eukprot:2457421-Rhodomonas_salina.3
MVDFIPPESAARASTWLVSACGSESLSSQAAISSTPSSCSRSSWRHAPAVCSQADLRLDGDDDDGDDDDGGGARAAPARHAPLKAPTAPPPRVDTPHLSARHGRGCAAAEPATVRNETDDVSSSQGGTATSIASWLCCSANALCDPPRMMCQRLGLLRGGTHQSKKKVFASDMLSRSVAVCVYAEKERVLTCSSQGPRS